MSDRLIERTRLPNGLTVELWDQSCRMAGDRWLVSLLARVEVPVSPEYFSSLDYGEQAHLDLVTACGDPLVFTQKKVKHFVDEKETNAVLAGLCRQLKDTLVPYLGGAKFASLYVLKKYGDLKDRQD